MSKRTLIAITVGGFLFAGIAGPNGPLGGFWGVEPTSGLGGGALGALITYELLQAVAFGAGLAWFAAGPGHWHVPPAVYLAIGWLLASPFPHGSLHQSIEHDNWWGLVGLEYGFHLTAIIAAVILARHVVQQRTDTPAGGAHQPSGV